MKIVGYSIVDYFSKKSNKQVNGLNLFVLSEDKNTVGQKSDSIYISANSDIFTDNKFSDKKVLDSLIGADCHVFYNKWGTAEDISFS